MLVTDSAFYKKKLSESNVRLISVLENFDNTPESIILESVLEGMAEYYSANLSREVKKGQKENALICKGNGGISPFGYSFDNDKNYVINEKESVAVRKIFSMTVNGDKTSSIVKWLNENNFITHFNKPFTTTSINTIVNNEKYKGLFIYGKNKRVKVNGVYKDIENNERIEIENGIPAIIDSATWDKANKIYSERKQAPRLGTSEIYLLAGKIRCGICGGFMCGNKKHSGRNKTLSITYRCSNRKRTNQCTQKEINARLIENIVIDALDRQFNSIELEETTDMIYNSLISSQKDIPIEINDTKNELKEVEKGIDSIVDAIVNGFRSDSLLEKMNGLENNKKLLVEKINYFEKQAELIKIPDKEFIRNKLKFDMDIKNISRESQKNVISANINSVQVYDTYCDIYTDVAIIHGAEGN